ncbi:MAG: DUF2892 domain-containing protein [Phormidium sp.]
MSVYQGTTLGIGIDIAATLLILSGAIGFCGIYRLLGINTCKSQ